MITFLLILGGLVTFNFILLRFSMQSVNTDKSKAKKAKINSIADKSKSEEIPNAA